MRRLYALILFLITNSVVTRAYAETMNTAPPPAPWWTHVTDNCTNYWYYLLFPL